MPSVKDLHETLLARSYPGRGLVAARLPDARLCLSYFLTGRSAASRSRSFAASPSGDVRVEDTSGGPHDDLRHYIAAVRRGGWTVVGNGDHVEPLASALKAGTDPASAWAAHTYEPDPPIFTPRIWLAVRGADGALLLGSARRSARPGGSADRLLLMPEGLQAGEGFLLTTYTGTAEDVVTSGTPVGITTSAEDGNQLLNQVWSALHPDLAVAALVVHAGDLTPTVRAAS